MLGIFAPYEYTWTTTGKGLLQMGGFIVTFLGVLAGVYYTYPDRQSYPREYEGGLQRELGGTGTLRVSVGYFPVSKLPFMLTNLSH